MLSSGVVRCEVYAHSGLSRPGGASPGWSASFRIHLTPSATDLCRKKFKFISIFFHHLEQIPRIRLGVPFLRRWYSASPAMLQAYSGKPRSLAKSGQG